ncbi:ZP4 protein, partial [Polypterus senegalus]
MWCKDKGQIAVVLLLFIFCDAFAQPRFKGRKQIAKHQKPAVMHYVEPRAGAPQTVTAQCTDSEVIVTISPDLLGIQKPVQPSDLSMGGCGVTSPAGAQPFVIEAPLQGCGSTVESSQYVVTIAVGSRSNLKTFTCPKPVTVQCTLDGQFVVVVSENVTLPSLDLGSIQLVDSSSPSCSPVTSLSSFVMYQFPVSACGSTVQVRLHLGDVQQQALCQP